MSAKPISSHVAEVLSQLEKVQTLTRDQRIQFGHDLYHVIRAVQRGAYPVDPLYPETDRLTHTVVQYVRALKQTDVLDDPPSPFPFNL